MQVPELAPDLGAVVTVGRSTSRTFDFSITPEEGWVNSLTVEGRRYTRALGDQTEPPGYIRVAGRTQRYHAFGRGGLFARPVLAMRMLAAADVGSRSPGFSVGGLYGSSVGLPLSTGLGIGGEMDFPVRGYREGSQFGDRAISGSVEYRQPIALVERGYKLVPAFLDRLWAAAFVDGGAAWCRVRRSAPPASVGSCTVTGVRLTSSPAEAATTFEVGGLSLDAFARSSTVLDRTEIAQEVRDAAYAIIAGKGYTSFGVATAIVRICEAIVRDEHAVLPVSTLLTGQLDIEDLYLSLPCVLGAGGIDRVLVPELSDEELAGLRASAIAVQETASSIGLNPAH